MQALLTQFHMVIAQSTLSIPGECWQYLLKARVSLLKRSTFTESTQRCSELRDRGMVVAFSMSFLLPRKPDFSVCLLSTQLQRKSDTLLEVLVLIYLFLKWKIFWYPFLPKTYFYERTEMKRQEIRGAKGEENIWAQSGKIFHSPCNLNAHSFF